MLSRKQHAEWLARIIHQTGHSTVLLHCDQRTMLLHCDCPLFRGAVLCAVDLVIVLLSLLDSCLAVLLAVDSACRLKVARAGARSSCRTKTKTVTILPWSHSSNDGLKQQPRDIPA